ncbi:MAG: type II secretion system F family protein [Lachnospiraceae bacterium]|nr:type II secretion system F family protein [Lachnospiraceae bacterium]
MPGPGRKKFWNEKRVFYIREGLVYLLLDMLISMLFFRSWIAVPVLLAGFPVFLRERQKDRLEEETGRMRGEFLTGIQLLSASLQAGYSAENAVSEARKELEKIYGEDTFIVSEFRRLCRRMELNVPVERLFFEMAERSGVDDIISFAQVFEAARKAGGDLIAISRNTVSVIRMKEETGMMIRTALSGKQMEQNMMSVIPLFILGYVSLTTDGLMEPMYTTLPGRIVMSMALLAYTGAFLWGRSIMRVRV